MPISIAAITVPGRLPMPPSTQMAKTRPIYSRPTEGSTGWMMMRKAPASDAVAIDFPAPREGVENIRLPPPRSPLSSLRASMASLGSVVEITFLCMIRSGKGGNRVGCSTHTAAVLADQRGVFLVHFREGRFFRRIRTRG